MPRPSVALPFLALFLLVSPVAQAAAPGPAGALGTLPATDSLDEWEKLSFQLTISETIGAGILGAVFSILSVNFFVKGTPTDGMGWIAFPIVANFGIGSLSVGTGRGINLRNYRKEKTAALGRGDQWDPVDYAAIRRWQARENRSAGLGMLIAGGLNIGMLAAYSASNAENVVGARFDNAVQGVFGVGIAINFGGGTTQIAMGGRELYWLEKEGR